MERKNKKLYDLVLLALFIAIELAMYMMGLGMVPVGPLKMSFLTVPVAVGAILMGPWQGAVLGVAFGLCSLWDAISGSSMMTNTFFAFSPVHTVILCVGMRALMGFCVGHIFKALCRLDRKRIVSYYASALTAPLLNTIFFMGYIVLVFYKTDYIQNLVSAKGAANPFMFVILLVGVQGLVEMIVCTITAGAASKGVAVALKKN